MNRTRKARNKLQSNLHDTSNGSKWLEAVDDAEVKIVYHRKRIRELTRPVRIFEEKEKVGEPWPGEK